MRSPTLVLIAVPPGSVIVQQATTIALVAGALGTAYNALSSKQEEASLT